MSTLHLSEGGTDDVVLAVGSSVSPCEVHHKITIPPVHVLIESFYFSHSLYTCLTFLSSQWFSICPEN